MIGWFNMASLSRFLFALEIQIKDTDVVDLLLRLKIEDWLTNRKLKNEVGATEKKTTSTNERAWIQIA